MHFKIIFLKKKKRESLGKELAPILRQFDVKHLVDGALELVNPNLGVELDLARRRCGGRGSGGCGRRARALALGETSDADADVDASSVMAAPSSGGGVRLHLPKT